MDIVRVYRNINAKDKFFGLELIDIGVMLKAFFLAFTLNKSSLFLNALFLILVYFGLRALKRGKPDGYILCLTRYVLSARFKNKPVFAECERLETYAPR